MPDAPRTDAPDAARLQAPLARLLRPLVRLLIKAGITFPSLCDLLRELYVNVAEYDFALTAKSQTDSRVSLLTGIHRKEVARLRGAGAPVSAIPAALSRTSRILARWLSAAEFTEQGRPRPLPRAGDASFETLVASVTRDVRPRAVLDEWLDRKLVVLDAEERVVLTEAAFTPSGGSDQQLYYFGRNIHDHLAAAVSNVLGQEPRFTERAVHYDGLSPELAQTLDARSREIAMDALVAANREADAACSTDAGGVWRWTFGTYIYREPVEKRAAGDAGKGTPEEPRQDGRPEDGQPEDGRPKDTRA